MKKINVFNPIFNDMANKIVPQHSYVGGPSFPEQPLYSIDEDFKDVKNVTIEYNKNDKLKSVVAKNTKGDSASAEIEIIEDSNLKVLCNLKKNDITELTISEWIENNKMHLTFRVPNRSEYDVDINIAPVNREFYKCDIDINFNNKKFEERLKIKTFQVPQIALDFANEISSKQSNLTVAAFNPKIIGIITMEEYKMFHEEMRLPWWHIGNFVGSVIGHLLTTCFGGAIIHIISLILIPEEAQ